MMRIGLLANIDAPYLGYQIEAMLERGIRPACILIDEKNESLHQKEIERERTQGQMPFRPLHEFAAHAIPVYFVGSHNGAECVSLVECLQIDILVNCGTPRILTEKILATPSRGVLNCHPGLLPMFRGCTCVEWALYLDEPVGNTVHLMSKDIDAGPIVSKKRTDALPGDTYSDLRCRVYRDGHALMAEAILLLENGLVLDPPPSLDEGRYFPVIATDKLTEAVGRLERGLYSGRGCR